MQTVPRSACRTACLLDGGNEGADPETAGAGRVGGDGDRVAAGHGPRAIPLHPAIASGLEPTARVRRVDNPVAVVGEFALIDGVGSSCLPPCCPGFRRLDQRHLLARPVDVVLRGPLTRRFFSGSTW
jgi:hypothetical protein